MGPTVAGLQAARTSHREVTSEAFDENDSATFASCCHARSGAGIEAGTDRRQYSGPAWSPYLVGGVIGGSSMMTFYLSYSPGASTAYARVAGMLGSMVAPKYTESQVSSGE